MRIKDIDNPETFQRLVHAIFTAQYGKGFQVVDDSAGDLGNDGYIRSQKTLIAIYCPEKRVGGVDYTKKVLGDLDKAVELRDERGYEIDAWMFVTPQDLREPIQRIVRDEASGRAMVGLCFGNTHLTDLFLRHPHLHDLFPEVATPRIMEGIAKLQAGVDEIKSIVEPQPLAGEAHQTMRPGPSPTQFIPTRHFQDIQENLLSGQIDQALAALDLLRLESTDPSERLWATVLRVQFTDRVNGIPTILSLTDEAIELAAQLSDHAALVALKAERAWALNVQFVDLDMRTYSEIEVGNLIGYHTITAERKKQIEGDLHRLSDVADRLFAEAVTLAQIHRLYRNLTLVLERQASALTHRFILLVNIPNSAALLSQVRSLSERIRVLHETAIRISAALGDQGLLGQTYQNYANELRLLGDLKSALTYARRAKELIDKYGNADAKDKNLTLLEGLTRTEGAVRRDDPH